MGVNLFPLFVLNILDAEQAVEERWEREGLNYEYSRAIPELHKAANPAISILKTLWGIKACCPNCKWTGHPAVMGKSPPELEGRAMLHCPQCGKPYEFYNAVLLFVIDVRWAFVKRWPKPSASDFNLQSFLVSIKIEKNEWVG